MYQSKNKPGDYIISHGADKNFDQAYEALKQKILKDGDKDDSPVTERFQILENLAKFNLGKFLIQNRGLNGKWNQYIVLHPQHGRLTGLSDNGKLLNKLEQWILDRCPIVLATQERFFTFQKALQRQLKEGISLASLPCGLMDDLLGLNFFGLKQFTLTGFDLDPDILEAAKANAISNCLEEKCQFFESDAWSLTEANHFNIIASNGLNIYEPDDERVTELYRNMYKALKKGGTLISSFLTPPPSIKNKQSSWDAKQINSEDLRIQKIILVYILNIRWQESYRTEEEMTQILTNAGFKNIKIIYDRQRIFPTITGQK